jgi:DeoR/GlpR family transcriptional regulator of sugar metabolism
MIHNQSTSHGPPLPGLAAERVERMRQILRARHVVRVAQLSRELGVSPATVRRDLFEMDRRGQARRVHGGAVTLEGQLDEPVFDDKAALAAREKQRIGLAALPFIRPTDSIFLDGGSTVLALARLLTEMASLTVVTNSLRVAALFAASGPRMIVTGGEVRRLSQTLVGPLTQPLIERIRVDTAFIGTIGFSVPDGLTTTDAREAQTKELIMSRAERVILLADSSKIGKVSFVRFGSHDRLDLAITDRKAPAAAVRDLRKRGVKVLLV